MKNVGNLPIKRIGQFCVDHRGTAMLALGIGIGAFLVNPHGMSHHTMAMVQHSLKFMHQHPVAFMGGTAANVGTGYLLLQKTPEHPAKANRWITLSIVACNLADAAVTTGLAHLRL